MLLMLNGDAVESHVKMAKLNLKIAMRLAHICVMADSSSFITSS